MNRYPLYVQEAVAELFPQAPDGEPRRDRPVWLGGVVEGLDMAMGFARVSRPVTGGHCPVQLSGAEEHRLEFRRLWVQRFDDETECRPRRGRHVLELTWRSVGSGIWLRRRYRDCYFEGGRWASNGRFESAFTQTFTAGRLDESIGGVGTPDETLPAAPVPAAPLLFVGSGPVFAGSPASARLLGVHRLPAARRLTRVSARCVAGTGTTPTVLRLWKNGVAVTGATLSLTAGNVAGERVWTGLTGALGDVFELVAESGPADVLESPQQVIVSVATEAT